MRSSIRLNFSTITSWLVLCGLLGLLSVPANGRFSDSQKQEDVVSYRGYKVIEIQTNSLKDLRVLRSLVNAIDYWSVPKSIGHNATASVSPAQYASVQETLISNNIPFSVLVEDLERTFENERRHQQIQTRSRKRSSISFDSYPRFNQISVYLDQLAQDYPSLVTVVNLATTDEYRPIKYIKISNSTGNKKNKTIFIDAGIHAREWIAPSTALYVINQLVENSAQNSDLLDLFDWIVLPMVNPDGFEYTHTNDRMWRKTRSSQSLLCKGVDGNRNFDFQWAVVGSSSIQCSDIFHGKRPFSEVETRAVRDILEAYKSTCKMYLSLHSYGNYLLYPWGYTSDLPDTWPDLDEVARAGANAIKVATGTTYQVGSSTNVLYAASGASDDYAFAEKKIPISITMELTGGGVSGFDLPASRIRASVEESWVGIRAMALKVNSKY